MELNVGLELTARQRRLAAVAALLGNAPYRFYLA